jgi:enoyl-CoA hydratase
MTAPVLFERRGDVEWLTLNRPERRNAIDAAMARAVADRFEQLCDEPDVRVVVLRGAGRGFSAGLDIHAHVAGGSDSVGPDLARAILAMRRCPQPVIALVHGAACGGGFAYALAADVRIAGASARMNDAFITIGVSGCELGLSYFLPRYVGRSVAAELMMTGDFIDAARAERVGLVSRVVADDALEAAGEELAAKMLRATPRALRLTKSTLDAAAELHDLGAVIDLETRTQVECMQDPEFARALAAFAQR